MPLLAPGAYPFGLNTFLLFISPRERRIGLATPNHSSRIGVGLGLERAASSPPVLRLLPPPRRSSTGGSPRRLAQAALTVCADRARSCSSYLGPPSRSKGGSGGAIKDYAEMLCDAEERLRQSAGQMTRMGRTASLRFAWRLSNVQTWAGATLTNTSTCLDSLATYSAGGADVDAIRRRVVAVAQATSNALALVNQLDPANHQ